MKSLYAAATAVALLAAAGPVSAQTYRPMTLPPPAYEANQPPVQPLPEPTVISSQPSRTKDDGSSSEHPIHNPGDNSAGGLNTQYQGGIPTAPGTGFPASPGQR